MRTQAIVRCIIIKGDGIVLCRNKIWNHYFLPGGGLEIGETMNQAIIRELGEEMGLKENQIHIHDDSFLAYENEGMIRGEWHYAIDLVKYVDIDADTVESIEDKIGFDVVKLSDLPSLELPLYPEKIRNYLIEKFCKK